MEIVSYFGNLSIEDVSELNRIHIHGQSVNLGAGITFIKLRINRWK
jgi:hypothetical protein